MIIELRPIVRVRVTEGRGTILKDMSNAHGLQNNILPGEDEVVEVGSQVTVFELGAEFTYQIVEPYEVDPPNKRISKDSPMARALLRKQVGDKVVVKAPGGDFELEIRKIEGGR
ncbi:MAG: GreA/GreB family elongation factor [Anaerolineae bacterium]